MKLKNQVCTLEQAKKLKELGLVQVAFFSHQHYPKMVYREEAQRVVTPSTKESVTDPGEWFCAFSCAELGLILAGLEYESYGFKGCFSSYFMGQGWSTFYRNPENFKNIKENFEYEAHSKAATLIYLLENGYMPVETCNKILLA